MVLDGVAGLRDLPMEKTLIALLEKYWRGGSLNSPTRLDKGLPPALPPADILSAGRHRKHRRFCGGDLRSTGNQADGGLWTGLGKIDLMELVWTAARGFAAAVFLSC
jgi:hypothetical protein